MTCIYSYDLGKDQDGLFLFWSTDGAYILPGTGNNYCTYFEVFAHKGLNKPFVPQLLTLLKDLKFNSPQFPIAHAICVGGPKPFIQS